MKPMATVWIALEALRASCCLVAQNPAPASAGQGTMPALPRRWGCKRRCPEAFLNDQVTRAQDRFAAGVVSNIEVVQAQDAVAVATE